LDSFCPAHQEAVASTDPDGNLGEIIIKIPNEATHLMTEGRPLRIGIEFSLEQPAGGLHFVVPPGEGSLAEVFVNLYYPNFASDCISFILQYLEERSHVHIRMGKLCTSLVSLHRFLCRGNSK